MTRPTVAELLPRLAPAQVLCIGRRGLFNWLVQRVTKSPFSHVVLVDQTASGIAITMEASNLDGVRALRLERHLEDPRVSVLRLRDSSLLTLALRRQIMTVAWLKEGAAYDVGQLVSLYLRRRLPWLFGGRQRALRRNRLDQKGRLICSELVSLAYQDGAGIRLTPAGVALGNVTPGDLAESLKLLTIWEWRAA